MKDGGPAFPSPHDVFHGEPPQSYRMTHTVGLSLRDYFAAAALSGLVNTEPVRDDEDTLGPARQVAKDAYRLADAMLAEREKS